MSDFGYLQHGTGNGPFRTEKVEVHNEFGSHWTAFFEGRWRKVHMSLSRLWIVYQGERITIQIEGV